MVTLWALRLRLGPRAPPALSRLAVPALKVVVTWEEPTILALHLQRYILGSKEARPLSLTQSPWIASPKT